ncbi:MAG TPA: hypothetical protein VF244_10910 [Acidimicrobiales bacterium]
METDQAAPVCFVDTETTGLDPDRHEIWEVALILPDGAEHVWQLPVDLARADPIALNIGRFHERRAKGWRTWNVHQDDESNITDPSWFAQEFVRLTRGLHMVGAVIDFDADRLWRLLRANGECPMWHYHKVEIEAMVVGYARGLCKGIATAGDITKYPGAVAAKKVAAPPWKSDELSRAIGVNPDDFDRHTALGDAQWARAMYQKVMG